MLEKTPVFNLFNDKSSKEQIYIKPLTLTDDDLDLEEALLLGIQEKPEDNPLLLKSQSKQNKSSQEEVKILGDFELVERLYQKDKKNIDKTLKYYTSVSTAYSSMGCCGGHTSATSQTTSQSGESSHNHEHCECGGHFNNEKCDSCGKSNRSNSNNTGNFAEFGSIDHSFSAPNFSSFPKPRQIKKIDIDHQNTFVDNSKSMIDEALEKGHDRIIMFGGLFVYKIY
jgi:hypothetical protein